MKIWEALKLMIEEGKKITHRNYSNTKYFFMKNDDIYFRTKNTNVDLITAINFCGTDCVGGWEIYEEEPLVFEVGKFYEDVYGSRYYIFGIAPNWGTKVDYPIHAISEKHRTLFWFTLDGRYSDDTPSKRDLIRLSPNQSF